MKTYKYVLFSLTFVFSMSIFADDAAIFKKKCGSCHTLAGVSKGKIGPDLTGMASKRPAGYIKLYTENPGEAKKKYPEIFEKEIKGKFNSAMPATKVSEDDMKAILNALK